MSSRKLGKSSSSEDDRENLYAIATDDKKRKRMLSNRESARRSRMKKEQHIKDLNDQVAYMRRKSSDMVQKIHKIEQSYVAVESENMILKMRGEELRKRLESLEGMLFSCDALASDDDKYGALNVMDILQDPNLFEPWLHPISQPQHVDGIYQF